MLYEFRDEDVVRNVVRTYPRQTFFVYDGSVNYYERFLNNRLNVSSYITKEGTLASFKTVSLSEFNTDFSYGDIVTGSSPTFFSSSLRRRYYEENSDRPHITSLTNYFNDYTKISPHFSMESDYGNKTTQEISIIDIPSIFYGSSIRKGSIKLSFYCSGSLIGELRDERENGELIQVGPVGSTGSGSVAGVCLYKEGILALTGSWDITNSEEADYTNSGASVNPKWVYFGGGIENDFGSGIMPFASFEIDLEGVQRTSVVTMMCHARKGDLNYSNNPSFLVSGSSFFVSSSSSYIENRKNKINNIVKSDYQDPNADFQKVTFVSKVFIYDEDMNVIGVAKLAKPVKKTEEREFTVKIKLDI